MQSQSTAVRGQVLVSRVRAVRCSCARAPVAAAAVQERFRLNNIGPAPGSRKAEDRKGRGYSAGQVRLRLGALAPHAPLERRHSHPGGARARARPAEHRRCRLRVLRAGRSPASLSAAPSQ